MNSDTYIPIETITQTKLQKSEFPVYIETYGCQMNFADSELVSGIMNKNGYSNVYSPDGASVILLNTCSIRENAESKIYKRLGELRKYKKKNPSLIVGILGCMAERLKRDIFLKSDVVDLVLGPDEYRKLPSMIENLVNTGEKGVAVRLSRVETYDDITPLRKEGISAWLSIMRGCDKFCSFCVVPYTRGRERSRKLESILKEVIRLWNEGFKEVTLLGQNVNSYRSEGKDFSDLLKSCAEAVPDIRIRFTTSHPQDLSLKLIETIARYDNLCKYIHLPVQSGSDRILKLMQRNYTTEHYLKIIDNIRKAIPDASLSTDIIAGFCTETEEDHLMTLELMKQVRYDGAYMFKYSPRENTKAWKMKDDVPEEVKTKRLMEIIELQNKISEEKNREEIGKIHEILIEGPSRKSPGKLKGRTDGNKTVIVSCDSFITGQLVKVKITSSNSATLFGEPVSSK
ncbi:MAG: tRNA (N6-isopentenyl adenosine(37)-C2)-methylthiotransferase MiaB [Ignavibacteria bacterium]|nr:tRNA (N6-isopentenyl adenosine(37)-C2)-methylthiotransferase MiaB [Ignavibacteria bacterium]